MKIPFIVFCLLLLSPSSQAQNETAEIVVNNANVHTIDSKTPQTQAIAIRGNRIIAVGTNSEIRKLIKKDTKVIDAKGKLLLPGFNDSHVHFTGIGNMFSSVDLRFVRNPEQVVKKLKRYVKFLPKGRWILGGQWDHTIWSPNKLPTKELIDFVTPDNPVFLYSKDAKMAWVNSAALKIAKIDAIRKDATDDGINRDSEGEPTGILTRQALADARKYAPRFNTRDWYEVTQTATNYAASLGVTSVQDVHSDDQRAILERLEREGKLKTRVYDCIALIKWKDIAGDFVKRSNDDSMIRRGCLKAMADSDPESQEVMFQDILNADKAGLQVMIHAIGRNQNESILRVFERVIKESGERDRRFRVEHAYRFRSEDLLKFGTLGIIASLQPRLFHGNDPYRSLLNSNAKIAFGSDASMTDFNPIEGINYAVNFANENEELTVEEAVYLYTMGSAYGEFQENIKGSITVGKLADLVILSDDIFSIDKKAIAKARVLMTIVDGEIVYRENF